jgi:mRNA-degrading endonuclease HigB of HigAB toxin-antitoxin module
MRFHINERRFSVDGNEMFLIHNILTGSKQIYINNILVNEIQPKFFECLNRHPLNIHGERYELVVTQYWYGKFTYEVVSRHHGYGLLDETLL